MGFRRFAQSISSVEFAFASLPPVLVDPACQSGRIPVGFFPRSFGGIVAPIRIHTPAKLNLYLELLERRADGFHELETVMTPISLYDSIEWSPADDEQISLVIDKPCYDPALVSTGTTQKPFHRPNIPTGGDNIVVKALEALRSTAGSRVGARVRLAKRIPAQAGLGGASSDAAAVLAAANVGWGLNWPVDRLMEVAAEIGSDVPFFLQSTAAVCRGRGEKISSWPVRTSLHFVLVKPPEGLSTPAVFRRCTVPDHARSAAPMLRALRQGDVRGVGAALHNRLQEASRQLTDWIERLEAEFASIPCIGHLMSGSGSSYFGVFRNRRQAAWAARKIRARRIGSVYVVRSVRGIRTVSP